MHIALHFAQLLIPLLVLAVLSTPVDASSPPHGHVAEAAPEEEEEPIPHRHPRRARVIKLLKVGLQELAVVGLKSLIGFIPL